MAKKLLILGNGFDIDLGMKTKYSDFAKSHYWDDLMENVYGGVQHDLLSVLKDAKEKEAWFDIEQVIYEYVTSLGYLGYDAKTDREEFDRLVESLTNYLNYIQKKQVYDVGSVALRVLREVVESGSYQIYSFNYTRLQNIADSVGFKIESNAITHMHGSLDNRSIILGILTDPLVSILDEYSFLYKDNSRFYMPNNMYEDFDKASDIIFFGHSINGMDFPYFKDFFIKQSDMDGEYKRKKITVFTYDDNSDMQIRNSIRRAQVDLTQLFRRNDIYFIQTKKIYDNDEVEKEKYDTAMKSIRNSKNAYIVNSIHSNNPFSW